MLLDFQIIAVGFKLLLIQFVTFVCCAVSGDVFPADLTTIMGECL
jgi:hypothetical protein